MCLKNLHQSKKGEDDYGIWGIDDKKAPRILGTIPEVLSDYRGTKRLSMGTFMRLRSEMENNILTHSYYCGLKVRISHMVL